MAQNAQWVVARRETSGKGAARSLRRLGKVPGVLYGRGRETEPITIDAMELQRLLAIGGASSTLLDVTVDNGKPVQALIRELQRNPLRPEDILHVDLYEVHAGEQITPRSGMGFSRTVGAQGGGGGGITIFAPGALFGQNAGQEVSKLLDQSLGIGGIGFSQLGLGGV